MDYSKFSKLCLCFAVSASAASPVYADELDRSSLKEAYVQFALHLSTPYPINLTEGRRTQLFKWEHRPSLVVVGQNDQVRLQQSSIDEALSVLEQAYEFSPVMKDATERPDIVLAFFDGSRESVRDALKAQIINHFEPMWAEEDLQAKISQLTIAPAPCTAHIFDRVTDLRKPDPFVTIMIDTAAEEYTDPSYRKQCIFEELGHATTFFGDIPTSFTIEESSFTFATIFDASGEAMSGPDTYTESDLSLFALLNDPTLTNGMPVSDAIDRLFQILDLTDGDF